MAKAAGGGGRLAFGLLVLVVAALALSWVWGGLRPGLDTRRPGPAPHPTRVQVLNGSGEGGVASRVASYLREGGFQVVEVRNADRGDWFASVVVARRRDLTAARAVARYLGGPPVIRQAWDPELADVTVVIGSDRSRLRLDPR